MRVIKTSVRIAAPPSRVWSVLMDFDAYPAWNPFILSLRGDKRIGGRLEAVIAVAERKPQTFKPIVVELGAEKAFAWRGSVPLLFTGVHHFALAGHDGGTQFEQSEAFSGLLVPFVGGILDATERGFRDMNEALRARCENQ